MIGGARIIGGDVGAYKRGYVRALRKCLETRGNLEQLQKLLREGVEGAIRLLKKRPIKPEDIEVTAFESAILDVLQEYNGLRSLVPIYVAWKIIEKRIKEVIVSWERSHER